MIPFADPVFDFHHALALLPAVSRNNVLATLQTYPDLARTMAARFSRKVKALREGDRRTVAAIIKEERAEVKDFLSALKAHTT